MRPIAIALLASFAVAVTAVGAQTGTSVPTPIGETGPEDVKIRQVFVYGEDPCPSSAGDEIVVCARMPDGDRYRIPKELRTDPNDPKVQSWANRARSFETVGASGIGSCSPVGGGGFTGCFQQLAKAAREERKAMLGSSSWADAVQKEREKRLGNLDNESEAIEQNAREAEGKPANPGTVIMNAGSSGN